MANFNSAVPNPSTLIDKLLMTCSVKLEPVELFPCDICDTLYCQKESLTNHLTTHVKKEDSTDFHEEITGINYAGTDCFGQKHMYSDKGKTVVTASGTLKGIISEDVTHPETQADYRSIRDRIKFDSEDTIDAALEATSAKIGGMTCNSVGNDLIIDNEQTSSNSTEKEIIKASDAHMYLKKSYGKLYFCNICNEKFAHQSSLELHKLMHHKQATISNSDQKVKSNSREDITTPIYTVAPYHICDICKIGFASNRELVDHLQTYIIDNRWKCRVCGKTFRIKEQLKHHQRIHTNKRIQTYIIDKRWKCRICEKAFRIKEQLTRHQRMHTDERPYSCNTCNINFRYYSSFAYHKRKLHVSKDQHPTCDVCNIQCAEKMNLQKHILSKHMTTGYPCRICRKECGHPVTLTKHILLVHKSQALQCKYCKKTFTQKCHKERHERLTHKKSYDFECDMCRQKFGRKDHLLRHIVSNCCQTPHKCRKCKRAYAKLADLKKHKKTCKKK